MVKDEAKNENEGVPADEQTIKVLQTIANSVHQSIQMTINYPSRHQGGEVSMLNVKKWIQEIEGRWLIVCEHYEKEMATKSVLHATSAIPQRTKRTVLTQEMLRIMLHCSRNLP